MRDMVNVKIGPTGVESSISVGGIEMRGITSIDVRVSAGDVTRGTVSIEMFDAICEVHPEFLRGRLSALTTEALLTLTPEILEDLATEIIHLADQKRRETE